MTPTPLTIAHAPPDTDEQPIPSVGRLFKMAALAGCSVTGTISVHHPLVAR